MSDFKNLVKISIKNKTVFHSAMEYFFSKTDRTSGYLAEQSVKYDIYSKLKKKYSKYVGKTSFKQYPGDESEKVWVCWFQGIENAPEIVQNCIKSLKYHIKDREIVFLNKGNIKDYVNLPDYIYEKWEKGIIPYAQFSDILRIELLIEHGGIWLDATTYLTAPLPEYITDSDFFVYHDGLFDKETVNMGNWLIRSKANNILLNETQNLLLKYWENENYLCHYFLFHMFFRTVTDIYEDEWQKMPYYNQMDNHILAIDFCKEFDKKRFEQIKNITSVHKLTHKVDNSKAAENSYLSKLGELYKM